MAHYTVLLKPASSECNLRCKYCFYADVSTLRQVRSFGRMKEETVSPVLKNVFCGMEKGDRVTFAFQGGEPTLAGLDFFCSFLEQVKKEKGRTEVNYTLQTNGTLLDEKWCSFLAEHEFLVGLSLDMSAEFHDENRVAADGKGTYKKVMKAKGLLEKYGVEYNILAVLTDSMARHGQQVWNYLVKQNIRYVQFIPCLDEFDAAHPSKTALTPERFALFYNEIFILWLRALKQGRYISIKLFDDLLNLLIEGRVTACGLNGRCAPQIVVEADGSVYPCDFYALDKYRAGSLREQPLRQISCAPEMVQFRMQTYDPGEKCGSCRYFKLCGGGCKRMRSAMYIRKGSNFCGYYEFLEQSLPELKKLAQHFRLSGLS